MPGFKQAFVQPLDQISATELDHVGDIQWRGSRAYKYVKYVGQLPGVSGDCVRYTEGGYATYEVDADKNEGMAAGILQTNCVDGDYIWIQIKGLASVTWNLPGNPGDTLGVDVDTDGAMILLSVVGDSDRQVAAYVADIISDVITCDFPF